jgi:hypothetical protein
MFDIRSHRDPNSTVNARHAATAGVRYAALILIVLSVAIWIWNRPWSISLEAIASPERIRGIILRAGLQPTGNFQERFTGLEGIEVASPTCSTPIAILPVMFGKLELPADSLSYRPGAYDVAYVFDGNLYSGRWISYQLGIVAVWRRLTSLISGKDSKSLHYYMKVWTPRGCPGLTPGEVERLRAAE